MPAPYVVPHDLKMDADHVGNIQIGSVDPGDTANDAALNGTHVKIITAASVGLPPWPDGANILQMRLIAGEAPRTTGRWIAEVYGRDDLETDYDASNNAHVIPHHFDGQDYTYAVCLAAPSNFGWDAGNARPSIITKRDLIHQDKWIDGVVVVNNNVRLSGHNAHGISLTYNKAGQVQQFTPRPGDSFQPALSDGRPYWAFQGDQGDVTTSDTTFSWALRLLHADEPMFFFIRLKKRDFSGGTDQNGVVDNDPGRYQVWAFTRAELDGFGSAAAAMAQTPIINYTGSTNAYGTTADATAFDPATAASWNPAANQTPRYMRKRPRYTYVSTIYYQNGSLTTMPNNAGLYDWGTRRFQNTLDAFATVYSTSGAPVNTSLPIVTATPSNETGGQLSTTTGGWSNVPSSFTYQWQRETAVGSNNFTNVAANGTASTYIIPQPNVGLRHRVAVTAINASGSATAFSDATAACSLGPIEPGLRASENPLSQNGNWATPTQVGQFAPKIVSGVGIQSDGTAGHSCQAYRTDISSADVGLVFDMPAIGNPNYAFALWARIQNPNSASTKAYLFVFNQGIGWRMFRYRAGVDGFVDITGGAPITGQDPAPGSKMKITCIGTAIKGFYAADGVNFAQLISVTDPNIVGAGSIGLEIADSGGGAAIRNFDQVAVNVAPTNITAPAVSGTAPANDGVLTVSDGTYSNGATVTGYQWTRDGADIVGATSNRYQKVQADVTHAIGCKVTAANAFGSVTTASSNTITVTQVAPQSITAPILTGNTTVGQTLTCSQGGWDYVPGGTTYAYQWKKNGVNIGGATASTYVTVAGDVGATITCTVTATNSAGATSIDSFNSVTPASLPVSQLYVWSGTGWV